MKLCAWKAVSDSGWAVQRENIITSAIINTNFIHLRLKTRGELITGPAPALPNCCHSVSKLVFDCFYVVLPAAWFRSEFQLIKDETRWVRNTSSSPQPLESWWHSEPCSFLCCLLFSRPPVVQKIGAKKEKKKIVPPGTKAENGLSV